MLESEILKLLKSSEALLSGEAIAKALKVSRVSIWKGVQRLIEKGYPIKITKKGYLLENKDFFLEEELQALLRETPFFQRAYYSPQVTSTMEIARDLSSEGENALVLAERQSAGRGRLGRDWDSDWGGLWLTLLLVNPSYNLKEAFLLTYLASIVVALALKEAYYLETRVKWPNDVLLENKKIAGILLEIKAEVDRLAYALIGIGINVNNQVSDKSFMQPAISVSEAIGQKVERLPLLKSLISHFVRLYPQKGEILSSWKAVCETLGKRVKIITPEETLVGRALDLDEGGNLLLETQEGIIKKISSGDCFHLREEGLP
jgi:BirA family biotin operon repressor/biotin-[acetyl-CoA-carboxylase] ligase